MAELILYVNGNNLKLKYLMNYNLLILTIMNRENYERLKEAHVLECNNGITDNLINKHIFELRIFPKKNLFKFGDLVSIPEVGEYGYIENFNSDGTLFIKKNFSDIGRDYLFEYVKKIGKKTQ